jgi:hypothetical protein
MTGEENPQLQKPGIFFALGKRQNQMRAFHISTAPATATLSQNPNQERSFPPSSPSTPSGSSFDWKRLSTRQIVDIG